MKNKYTETQLLDLRIELYEYYKFLQKKTDNTSISFSLSSAGEAFTNYGIFGGSSDSNGDYERNKMRNLEKIIEKDQSISEQVFKEIVTDVFSDNQLEAYEACLNSCPKQNGVYYEVTGDLEDVFAVNLNFSNTVGQEKVTLSNTATLVNCEPIGGFLLKEGLVIKNGRSVTQYLKIINKEKPSQIGINFNELSFGAINFGDEYIGGSKSLPIGTIISSTFKYETFLEVNRFKTTENMSKAIWVPCDGRNVRSSKYGEFSGSVPDLRGLFLRNVNDYNVAFDGVGKVKSEQKNPDNTSAGVVQKDAFQGHRHFEQNTLVMTGSRDLPNQPDQRPNQKGATNSAGKFDAGFGTPRISTETRPKNMTVYYYIKIN
ncbi:hypothetical protein H8K90_07875 [Winogradskyella echinorum]|uniref:Phage Tail Collar Domain n=1 Tax=Winogradskyella echinorum TaxID=538189 RepID=A0ABR6Y0R1_9FLAO|nr:hypothetical protein [Winogradskyella echinorum]MBC3846293.1 hypothetical protein [Winogradskyella echinorum]MBC5750641.1 hypothetical protein [Winogradskyella echinorum]